MTSFQASPPGLAMFDVTCSYSRPLYLESMTEVPPQPPMPATPAPSKKPWFKRWWVWVIAGVVVLGGIGGALGGGDTEESLQADEPAPEVSQDDESDVVEEASVAEEDEAEAEPVEEPAEDPEPVEEPEPTEEAVPEGPDLTASQANAVRSAENYVSMTAFSRDGLIEQLEFEQYSTEDATFAVDHINADWGAEAVEKAEDYIDMMGFSKQGLIDQLEFDKFTPEDANNAADVIDVDWNAEAAEKAQDYVDMMGFSRQSLIDQLIFDGFTPEQAAHGASAVGL